MGGASDMAERLTDRRVSGIKAGEQRLEVSDLVVPGLRIVVQPTGRKSWAVRYRNADGKTKKWTVGSYPDLSLAVARELARKGLERIALGQDPAAEKAAAKAPQEAKAQPAERTVADVVESYLRRRVATLKSADSLERLFRKEVIEPWGRRSFEGIRKADVVELLDNILDRGSPTTARLAQSALRGLWQWAIARGLTETDPLANTPRMPKSGVRSRVLQDDELRALWSVAGRIGRFGPLYRLLVLTGARRGEVAGMRWDELQGDVWHLAAERTKNGQPHVLRLPKLALAELERVERRSPFVFGTGDGGPSGWSKSKKRVDRLMAEELQGEVAPWVVHDIRRTFASNCARAGVRLEVVEKALNHQSGSFGGIVSVYQKYSYEKEIGEALEAHARLVEQIVYRRQSNVVPIRH
ncbi:MAG: site-specific integrase [Pseudomonadota bacterium]